MPARRYAELFQHLKVYILDLINTAGGAYAPLSMGVTNGNSHDHNGGDGAQIDHVNLANTGTSTHAQIDTFIASKGAASGLASLDANSLVVQNPTNATTTPTASKIPIADANGKLDGWITDASTSAKGKVQLATDGESVASKAVQANDTRLSNARTPTAHASTHKHGGSDEVASATAGANLIPKAGSGGTLDLGWLPSVLTGKDADTLDGQHGSYYRDASNINAGTLSTDRYSAYADLVAESKIGTGSSQVAAGNHTHSSLDPITASLIPNVSDAIDLGSSTKLWRKGWLSELDAVLFAQNTVTLLGGWLLISKDEGVLPADVSSVATTINFGKAMTQGDFVLFRANGQVEYVQVGTLVSGTTYNVTRNLDGSGANSWYAGTPFAVLGQSGQGRIELNAYDTPRIQLLKQGATYNATTELIRIGDLNGNWGYSAQKWGVAIGEYASGKPNIVIDEDGNLKIRNYNNDVIVLSGTDAQITNVLKMSGTSSAIAIGSTPPTSSSSGTGIWIDRTGLYSLASNTRQVWIDASDGIFYSSGGDIWLDRYGINFNAVATKYDYGQLAWWDGSTDIALFGTDTDLYAPTLFKLTVRNSIGILISSEDDIGYDYTYISMSTTKISLGVRSGVTIDIDSTTNSGVVLTTGNIYTGGGTTSLLTYSHIGSVVADYSHTHKFDIAVVIGDGVNTITTGSKGYVRVPRAATVTGWKIVANASGSIVVDVKRCTYSGFPTTSSIAGSEKPTLSSAQKNEDTSLTTWTTSLAEGDWLEFYVDSASTVKQVTVALQCTG